MASKTLDGLYEAAMAEARRQRRGGRYLKAPCPVDRVRVSDDGAIECVARRPPNKVKLGKAVARVDRRGMVNSPRVLAGLPAKELRGLDRDIRANRVHARECEAAEGLTKHQKFASPGAALKGLFSVNPDLSEALYRLWRSKLDDAYKGWLARGMRGPRPTVESVYGSSDTSNLPVLDFLSAFVDRPGRNRTLHSITEALYATVPASKRWEDWLPALEALQDEINAHSAEDDYVPAWNEIKIPGRAGKTLEATQMQRWFCQSNEPKTAARLIEERRQRLAAGREPGADEDEDQGGDGDAPF